MVELLERIGPVLGVVAFVGLAILAFLIFQQAREVRRLREWAGRAPERASDAAEASLAAAEARGEAAEPAVRPAGPIRTRLRRWRERAAEVLGPRWDAIDRNFPFDPRYLVILIAAAIVAAGVLTSGFGLFSGDDGTSANGGGGGKQQSRQKEEKPEVAVLNATQVTDATGVQVQSAVSGLADKVSEQVLKPAGYEAGRQDDAATGLEQTVIMFEPEQEADATALAEAIEPELGPTEIEPMIQEVRDLAGGADLALLIGQDDAEF